MTSSGILNVDKPPGVTSHDIVRMVRRGSNARRVGHAGTLDPAATGVLLVLAGQAVRISEYLMDLPKTYRATLRLGITTTTYDAEGEVTSTANLHATGEELRQVLMAFRGEIQQSPPAYSAVKVEGERAYARARRGEKMAMKPRPVQIYRIELLRFAPPLAEIEVECGRGTYIRSLAHDAGRRLGCGAHLAGLRRMRVGPFAVDAAMTEEQLRAGFGDGTWRELLQPMDCGLIGLPAITVPIEDEKDLRHGQAASLEETALPKSPPPTDGLDARGYAEDGSLIGIIRYDAAIGMWRPRKVFAPEGSVLD